jgi:putative zinc finger/helix-turn-helix YgiT family protein
MNCARETYHYPESGLDNVFLEGVDICRCDRCGEEAVKIPAVVELNDLIGKAIIRKRALLNKLEIKFLRKNMGFTGKALADAMHLDNATISRWESGKQKISEPHDILLRLIYCGIKGIPAGEQIENHFKHSFFDDEVEPFVIPNDEIDRFRKLSVQG